MFIVGGALPHTTSICSRLSALRQVSPPTSHVSHQQVALLLSSIEQLSHLYYSSLSDTLTRISKPQFHSV